MNPNGPSDHPPKGGRFPRQIRFIVTTEACERLSYYGMLSILTLYLKNGLGMERGEATETAHLFKMAVYFLPLAGAWLADRWAGRYGTILGLSLFYCLGHGTLAWAGDTRAGLFAGLALIAVGAGGIKPCVSAFVGDQFAADQQHLLPKVYAWFYWAINLGAFLAFALIPLVRDWLGYGWAFGIPGLCMGVATSVFWLGRRHYVRQPSARDRGSAGFLAVLGYALTRGRARRPGEGWLGLATARYGAEAVQGMRAVLGILLVFAAVPVFWALFDQINTTWVLQGEAMRPFVLLGYKVDAERIQSVSALLVLIWVPVLTWWVYPWAERRGCRPTPLRRMGTGMALAAVAFGLCGMIQAWMDRGASVSLAWQLLPYAVLEAGEVMLSATGLEFAFAQAPVSMKSTIMSFWLLTVAVGNFLVAALTRLNDTVLGWHGAASFLLYAGLMGVVTAGFAGCAVLYRRHWGDRPEPA